MPLRAVLSPPERVRKALKGSGQAAPRFAYSPAMGRFGSPFGPGTHGPEDAGDHPFIRPPKCGRKAGCDGFRRLPRPKREAFPWSPPVFGVPEAPKRLGVMPIAP